MKKEYPEEVIKSVEAGLAYYNLSKIKNPTNEDYKNAINKLTEYAFHCE